MNTEAQVATPAVHRMSPKRRLYVAALAVGIALVASGCSQYMFVRNEVVGEGSSTTLTVNIRCLELGGLFGFRNTDVNFDASQLGTPPPVGVLTHTFSIPTVRERGGFTYYGATCTLTAPGSSANVSFACENIALDGGFFPNVECIPGPGSLVVIFKGFPSQFPDVSIVVFQDFTAPPTTSTTEAPPIDPCLDADPPCVDPT